MPDRAAQREVAAPHHDHVRVGDLGEGAARVGCRGPDAEVARSSGAGRRRARPRARRPLPDAACREVARAGGQEAQPAARRRPRGDRARRWAPPARRASSRSNPGVRIVREPEHRGLITGEIDDARVGPSRASTSAAAAATTEVPEPPFGDQKHTSMKNASPRSGAPRGAQRKPRRGSVGKAAARYGSRANASRVTRGRPPTLVRTDCRSPSKERNHRGGRLLRSRQDGDRDELGHGAGRHASIATA